MTRVVWFTSALVALLSLSSLAGQSRSVADGVYSTPQAARGLQIYRTQCAECHGAAMEGTSGPPLAGDFFLSNWSTRSLSALVDRIQKTMPFSAPGTLTRQQSTDLVAAILQGGKFPGGSAELSDVVLAQTTFPQAQRSSTPAPTTSGATLPPAEGNLAELMRAIAFPNSNIIFNVQVKDPGQEQKSNLAVKPFDYVEWGSTQYRGWLAVDQAAVAIIETAPLLLTPGRKCQNGRPVPVDRADWKAFVAGLSEAGRLARRTSQARNYEAFGEVSEKLNDACANCHKVYRDKGGTEGSGTARCQ
jgi:S-disulfanyl-L-cysteine oxidoreductase SoxD